MGAAKSVAWSFWWVCSHCDNLRQYLVNECPGQDVVWARCGTCSSLVRVADQHRRASV